jgi:arylsulfatase A-like enzyme
MMRRSPVTGRSTQEDGGGAAPSPRPRRTARVLAAFTVVAVFAAACAATISPPGPTDDLDRPLPAPGAPNIVVVLADDLDAVTPYWDAMPRTKELIADRGLTFTRAAAPTPICCPARATILTGKLGHNTGVLTNGGEHGGWEAFATRGNEEQSIAVALESAGYRTAMMGKYMNGIEEDPTHIPPGWTEWYVVVDNLLYAGYGYRLNENGRIISYGSSPQDYATDVLARKGKDFIQRADDINDDRPFFLMMTPTAPHLPLPPAPRHADNGFRDDLAPRTPNYAEPDLSDKPTWLRASAQARSASMGWVDTDYRNRMGSLMALDDMVVGLIDELRDTGELDNTVIMFASDNGYNNGSHRLIHKMAPYEESLFVPMVIAGPGIPHGTTDAMVTHADLAPTFAEMGGATMPGVVDGRSLVPLLATGAEPEGWRTEVLEQYETGGAGNGIGAELTPEMYYYFFIQLTAQEIPSYTALRNERWKIIRWDAGTNGTPTDEWELYDLQADPYELDNLLATPEGRAANSVVFDELSERMIELSDCAGPTCP